MEIKNIMQEFYAVVVMESEAGWGARVDDYMICVDMQSAQDFIKDFNSQNTEASTPAWYMYADKDVGTFKPANEKQVKHLIDNKTVWLSALKAIK